METAVAKTEMLIRQPLDKVFAAFADPDIITQFWFTHASAPLAQGTTVRWEWAMFGVGADVLVRTLEPNQRIVIEWPGRGTTNTVEWLFTVKPGAGTVVSIRESGFDANASDLVAQVADATGGFSLVLAGAKAYLEHHIALNLIADRFPHGAPC